MLLAMDLALHLDAAPGAPGDPAVLDEALRDLGLGGSPPRIRCPLCAWRPRREDRWWCRPPGCGHAWNTFETAGRCPRCHYQWVVTACLACHRYSLHADWYERPGDPGRAP